MITKLQVELNLTLSKMREEGVIDSYTIKKYRSDGIDMYDIEIDSKAIVVNEDKVTRTIMYFNINELIKDYQDDSNFSIIPIIETQDLLEMIILKEIEKRKNQTK